MKGNELWTGFRYFRCDTVATITVEIVKINGKNRRNNLSIISEWIILTENFFFLLELLLKQIRVIFQKFFLLYD